MTSAAKACCCCFAAVPRSKPCACRAARYPRTTATGRCTWPLRLPQISCRNGSRDCASKASPSKAAPIGRAAATASISAIPTGICWSWRRRAFGRFTRARPPTRGRRAGKEVTCPDCIRAALALHKPTGGNHALSNGGRSHSCRVVVGTFVQRACIRGCDTGAICPRGRARDRSRPTGTVQSRDQKEWRDRGARGAWVPKLQRGLRKGQSHAGAAIRNLRECRRVQGAFGDAALQEVCRDHEGHGQVAQADRQRSHHAQREGEVAAEVPLRSASINCCRAA